MGQRTAAWAPYPTDADGTPVGAVITACENGHMRAHRRLHPQPASRPEAAVLGPRVPHPATSRVASNG
jgi:hypothetical protein